jgi:hypothetical protein
MLEALPRKPKAKGKKLLRTEGRREVSDGPGGEEGDDKAEVHPLKGLNSGSQDSWVRGASLILYPLFREVTE